VIVRPDTTQDFQGLGFILRFRIGVDEEQADRIRTLGDQLFRSSFDGVQIDRRMDAAIGQHAFRHFQAQIAGNDRIEPTPQAPGLRTVPTAHLQDIAEAFGRDQTSPRALALQQRVGANGRPMHDGCEDIQRWVPLG